MKKIFIPLFLIIFFLCNSSRVYAGTKYFIHVEIGYTLKIGEPCPGKIDKNYCLPEPQWSNPENYEALKRVEGMISQNPRIQEIALKNISDFLYSFNQNGGCKNSFCNGNESVEAMFLTFPFFAENHGKVLKDILNQGFAVGLHMHENWTIIIPSKTPEQLRDYIKIQKNRLESAILATGYNGYTATIFSYGPSVELNDVDKEKMFKAVKDAGFTEIQTISEYYDIARKVGLNPVANKFSFPHLFELITKNDVLYNDVIVPRVENFVKNTCCCREDTDGIGFDNKCHVECNANSGCDERRPGTSWCDGNIKKTCSSSCQYSQVNCGYDSYYCSNGQCVKKRGGRCMYCYILPLGNYSLEIPCLVIATVTILIIIVIIFGVFKFFTKKK